ncbi:NAD(P)H-quinone oxidoreductase subunit O [Synechococcus sp. M16CYN]|uniref:NAD(P)H-quinone oxidoreductase subunit O n=1 Tax=Synechococcus sp. M16CYN TaxID=3103139 RepID=UPI00324F7A0F
MSDINTSAPAKTKPTGLRKGTLVKVNRKAYSSSIEAAASDPIPPNYIFEGPGELLVVKGNYGQVRWKRPVPDVWLRIDQLEVYA